MDRPTSAPRNIFVRRLSITVGNILQAGGATFACTALAFARSASSKPEAIAAMVAAWTLLYFCCHAVAHWAAGRLLGIRFAFYTVGGTGNPTGYPAGLRWVFEHLPFFGVQTQKGSIAAASPRAKAAMWSAGVASSAIVPTLSAFYAWSAGVPGAKLFSVFAVFWAIGTLSSNWRSQTGDFAKARRALRGR